MITVNQIVFDVENYGKDENKMWIDIANQLKTLINNKYVCKVCDAYCGLVVIEYEHNNALTGYGNPELHWLTIEEVLEIESAREGNEEQKE